MDPFENLIKTKIPFLETGTIPYNFIESLDLRFYSPNLKQTDCILIRSANESFFIKLLNYDQKKKKDFSPSL